MPGFLTQFGIGDYRFEFADYPKLYQLKLDPDRFDDVDFSSQVLPGLDGVFPAIPQSRGRTSSTTISLKFRYAGDDQTDFTALKQALHQMKSWGLTYLFKRLEDNTLVFTMAACTRVHLDPANDSQAHIWPRGELTFFCPKARWYGKPGMAFFDNGEALDDTLTVIPPQIDTQTVDDEDVIELTNNGDAPAGVWLWWEAPEGESVTNPSLKRLAVDAVSLADQLTYNGTLTDSDVLILDARNHQAQLNMAVLTAGAYGNIEALRATWFEIPPGTSEIIVNGTFSNGAILSLDLWDTFY